MKSLSFKSIIISIPPEIYPLTYKDLEGYEQKLGFKLPEDYRDFLCTLGIGSIELGIGALHPQKLNFFAKHNRERFAEHWFWDQSPDILTQAKALECLPFFDDDLGSDILFHPSDVSRWFVLPHEDAVVLVMHSFKELCDYCLSMQDDVYPPYEFTPDRFKCGDA